MSNELNLTYENNFASARADGRHVCTMAAHMAMLRDREACLSLPENLTEVVFPKWKEEVKNVLKKQLRMPKTDIQPPPAFLYSVQREGYRAEKWEFYPDDFTVVPFIVLVPDGASPNTPAPAVMCFLDLCQNKEVAAGEPLLEHPNCQRNEGELPFAKEYAKSGMVTFVFDSPGMGECSVMSPTELGETQEYICEILCHGLLETGCGYLGLTVFQRLRFMECLNAFPYVDRNKIAISSRGLGAEAAVIVGLLSERVGCIVYGDVLRDYRRYYVSATEQKAQVMAQDIGKWRILPGKLTSFGYQDLCAAFSPRKLCLCGGSNEELADTVRRAYKFNNADGALYCGLTDKNGEKLPSFGLDKDEIYVSPVLDPETEISFLKKCFEII